MLKRIKKKLTANVLFSGIGCQERGFEDSDVFDIEVLTTSEICKESVLSYAAVHCGLTNEVLENYDYPPRKEMAQYLTELNLGYEPSKNKYYDWSKLINRKSNDLEKFWLACKLSHNLGDISRIEDLPYADLWTCSFPCTDISVAGKLRGMEADEKTRSSLLWENIRLLRKAFAEGKSPKFLLFENVKNLISKTFIDDFKSLLDALDELGFNSYYELMNACYCGVPQNRERVFVVCIRKDIDSHLFCFPKPFDTGERLIDVLDMVVDKKYGIPDETVKRFLTNLNTDNALLYDPCQVTRMGKSLEWTELSPTIAAHDSKDPKLINTNVLKQVGQLYGTEVEPNPMAGRVYSPEGTAPTLNSCSGGNRMPIVMKKYKIRKLTPKECWRLMGLRDEDVDRAYEVGVADSHLYKQAGNGIVTNCVALIAEHLYEALYNPHFVCTDEKYEGNFLTPPMS